jgi:hypothetical protein
MCGSNLVRHRGFQPFLHYLADDVFAEGLEAAPDDILMLFGGWAHHESQNPGGTLEVIEVLGGWLLASMRQRCRVAGNGYLEMRETGIDLCGKQVRSPV